MTDREAIERFRICRDVCDDCLTCSEHDEALTVAIQALQEREEQARGCEYCTEYKDLPEHFVDGKPDGRVFDTSIQMDENGRWHLEMPSGVDIGIRFCPMCGRPLEEADNG